MPKMMLQGSPAHRWRSLRTLLRTTAGVLLRRAVGRPLVPGWTVSFEIGTLFYRHQFDHAFWLAETAGIAQARAYFDSLYTVVDAQPAVEVRPSAPGEPRGHWFIPRACASRPTMLYFHGGGYAFYAEVSRHFIAMLADRLQVRIFAPDYRLTPEHPHPAQTDDAMAACRYLLEGGLQPGQWLIGGDSAGGHLALMTLLHLRRSGLSQPALALALSPWTDIGRRGDSQFGHDRYDMVQGYQTLQFAQWLKDGSGRSDAELSPTAQDFSAVAPIYLQAGGKEILVDMIRDFARLAQRQGARVRLDVWPDMTHEFHAYGETLPQSREAIDRLRRAIAGVLGGGAASFDRIARTEVDGWALRQQPLPACRPGVSLRPPGEAPRTGSGRLGPPEAGPGAVRT